ncbi:MAG: hypothetical protein ACK4XK_13100 [Casimicrobiaceae bacterium]
MIDEQTSLRRTLRSCLLIAALASLPGLSARADELGEQVARFDSRELVDVHWLDTESSRPELQVLVPGPHADAPGLYRVTSDTAGRASLVRLCALAGRAHLSFDRHHLLALSLEQTRPRLEVRDLSTCQVKLSIPVQHKTFDFDATSHHVVAASRSEDGATELRLFDAHGRLERVLRTDRNIELGFDLDGWVLHNFDRVAASPRAFGVPDLRPRPDAALSEAETAIPGSRWRWVRAGEQSHLRDVAAQLHALPPAVWLDHPLAMSRNARFLLTYHHDGSIGRLRKVDLSNGQVIEVTRGSIDSASVNATGSLIAWIKREGDDRVSLWRNRRP